MRATVSRIISSVLLAVVVLAAGCGKGQGTGLLALNIFADSTVPPGAASNMVLSLPGTADRIYVGSFPPESGSALVFQYPDLPASNSPVILTLQAFDSNHCLVASASQPVTIVAGAKTTISIQLVKAANACGDGGIAGGLPDGEGARLDGNLLEATAIDGSQDSLQTTNEAGNNSNGEDVLGAAGVEVADVPVLQETGPADPLGSGGAFGTGGVGGTGGAASTGGTVGTVPEPGLDSGIDVPVGTGTGTATDTTTSTRTDTGTGTGTGTSAGATCTGAGECQLGLTCLDGVCCTQANCPQCQNCGVGGMCNRTVTNADDTTGVPCTGTNMCDAAGACKRKSGAICSLSGDCASASATCTDGRCCIQTCLACQACSGAGGVCVAVTNADDADTCAGATTCNALGVCKKKPGQTCSAGTECASGNCLDGVCCTPSTCPQCLNCGAGGVCNITVSSADDTTGTTCAGTSTCDATGACKRTNGTACSGSSDCASASATCTDGRCCVQTCGVCQACTGAGGTCVAVTSVDDADSCTGANTCDSGGACKKKSGQTCSAGTACASGNCVDGFCCAQSSCPQCKNCAIGGACTTVANADDTTGVTCTGTNTCDATGTCKKKPGQSCAVGTDCASGNCVDGVCCTQSSCPQCRNCGAGGACSITVSNADDATGATCSINGTCDATGTCKKKNGQSCAIGAECLSGACVANVCSSQLSCSGPVATCGPSGNENCCTSLLVSGGAFYRSYNSVDFTDKSFPATVADFYLDKYEITVGRFRQFVNASKGTQANPPAAGAGLHPLIQNSGWSSGWNSNLATDTAGLKTLLSCNTDAQTWTDDPGPNENRPMNCISWYETFAFCAWDGGRLPTEAEWDYAAAGGSDQRYYPWSSPPTSTIVDDSYVVYCGGACAGTQKVGSKSPKGDGKWGQADLAGNVLEWTLDWYGTYPTPCNINNCANLTSATSRVLRGGAFDHVASYLRPAYRGYNYPIHRFVVFGARCARSSPF